METETRARRSCANAVDNYVKNERGRLCDARDALERETRDAARARARAHPRSSNRPTPVEFCACIRLRSMTSTTPRRF